MQIETVTTSDGTLLQAIRRTLADAQDALLCVAFVHERGLQLLLRELKGLQVRKAKTRLLVTTTFATTTPSALSMAARFSVEVRVLNPGGKSTFHPKLYLGETNGLSRAVIGSANLTGGLFSNIEVAVALHGTRESPPIERAWDWAQTLWEDPRGQPWVSVDVASNKDEFNENLFRALTAEVRRNPIFLTLGQGRSNRVVELTPSQLSIETERSLARAGGAELVPAWMFNLAWDRLRTHGTLANVELLNDLRVHRSSAVCAILARLPNVEAIPGKQIVLRWIGGRP